MIYFKEMDVLVVGFWLNNAELSVTCKAMGGIYRIAVNRYQLVKHRE